MRIFFQCKVLCNIWDILMLKKITVNLKFKCD